MIKKEVATEKAPGAIGPYSQGIVAGGLVFTSGQLPINPKDNTIPTDIADQAKLALENVQAVLQEAGTDLRNAVKLTVYLTDIRDFVAVNEVYKEVFQGKEPFPARSAVQVAALPKSGAFVEIEAVALTS